MAVYLIVNIEMTDPAAYQEYIAKVPQLIGKHRGEYLARGGQTEVLEGDWQPKRLVIFRYPDRAHVEAFLNDPEYQPLKAIRHRAARTDMVMVEGV